MINSAAHPMLQMANAFISSYPNEAGAVLERAPVKDVAALIAKQQVRNACALLERMTPATAAECITLLNPENRMHILPALNPGKLALMLLQLSSGERSELSSVLSPEFAKEVSDLMSYPEGTAGSLMDPKVMSFLPDTTVKEILSKLRTLRQRKVHTVFIVDNTAKLTGAIRLQDVILAEPAQRLSELVHGSAVRVHVMAPRDEVVEVFSQHKMDTLPVVDLDDQLMGVVRQDAVIHAVQDEAMSDMQTMVGAGKDERALSSPLYSVRKRLPWLNINLLTAFMAASVVGLFEDTIAQVTALAVLLPVVAGQSGNTGAQALAVTMRGLALREVRIQQWPKLVLKEALAGLCNGVANALVTAIGVYIWSKSIGLCMVIGVSMVVSMVIAGVSGAAIPVILRACGQDPAQSSSIILTTVTDVMGFFSFLGLATIFSAML